MIGDCERGQIRGERVGGGGRRGSVGGRVEVKDNQINMQ